MKITKDKLIQIIKEEAMALMESGYPLPKKKGAEKDPHADFRKAKKVRDDRAKASSELDRILGPEQELDPKTLAWIDNLIKKPDGLEQIKAVIKRLK